tara:strand:+ start:1289 stop:1828 length:540 start_codon:yes stop_codon:yes gene_type:complete
MKFYDEYFSSISKHISDVNQESLEKCAELAVKTSNTGGKVIIAGNGGSAAIASHVAVDFTKAASIRAINFNESDLITCFANDYGYEFWVQEALKAYSDKDDLIILVSSSGNSKNIINAAEFATNESMSLITLSGFSNKNELRKYGNFSFWVDSNNYNYVEMTHHIWLLSIVDRVIEIKK